MEGEKGVYIRGLREPWGARRRPQHHCDVKDRHEAAQVSRELIEAGVVEAGLIEISIWEHLDENLELVTQPVILRQTKQRLLKGNFRGTNSPQEALFEESTDTRLCRMKILNPTIKDKIASILEASSFHPIGIPEEKRPRIIQGETFTFNEQLQMWHAAIHRMSIFLRPDCDIRDAEAWLAAFNAAVQKNFILQKTWESIFILGGSPQWDDCVAQTAFDLGIVELFNHPAGARLHSALIAETTGEGISPLSTEMIIHHECVHLIENKVYAARTDLAYDIYRNPAEANMRAMAEQINHNGSSKYLVELIDVWIQDKTGYTMCHTLVGEFLIEAYAELVVEKHSLPIDVWPAFNAVNETLTGIDQRFHFDNDSWDCIAENKRWGNRSRHIRSMPPLHIQRKPIRK